MDTLITPAHESHVTVVETLAAPGGSGGEEYYTLPSECEVCYVLEGTIELEVDGEAFALARGDAVTFGAERPAHVAQPVPERRGAGRVGDRARPARPARPGRACRSQIRVFSTPRDGRFTGCGPPPERKPVMSESIHVLIVRAAGLSWALPMGSVEQTLAFGDRQVHNVAGAPVVVFRDDALEVVRIGARLGFARRRAARRGVVVWAGGAQAGLRRRRAGRPDGARAPGRARRRRAASTRAGVVILGSGEIVPVLEPGVIAGAWSPAGEGAFGFSELQRSALLEIANIGSGNAATALSQLLGKPVEITYAEALLATLAEAADKIGAAAAPSAVVDTPVADDGGKVLLLFPDGAGEQLCELFGTRLDDEMGRSALREVGNILASSYLNAVVEMTGMELEPQPPTIEVDLLGSLVSRSLAGIRADDPTVLMRSVMSVEASDSSFAFLFVPQFGAVTSLLDHLGVGSPQSA